MEIVFITPEMTPYSRTGPIGDVCAALPRGLRGMDHKVFVISPLWSGIDPTTHALARKLSTVPVQLGEETVQLTVFDGRTTGGVDLIFIGHEDLLSGEPPDLTRPATPAQLRSAAAFGQAAIAIAKERCEQLEVVHGHSWFAAPALVAARSEIPNARRVLSLHDPKAIGAIDRDTASAMPADLLELAGNGDGENLLRAGARVAERVVASSLAAAEALRVSSNGLGDALEPEGKLSGIAAGLDASRWNPVTDALLTARFDPVDLGGKARCKDALQYELGLPVRADVPLLLTVADGGLPVLLPLLAAILRNDVQLVVQGASGDVLEQLDKLAEEHTERLALMEVADERALHRGVAAADALIIAGDSPVSGELHLSGQRYGALPIGPRVGAIADGIVDCDANLDTGNGFIFELGSSDSLLSAIQRALSAYSNTDAWSKLRNRTMTMDVSWEKAARRYEQTYR